MQQSKSRTIFFTNKKASMGRLGLLFSAILVILSLQFTPNTAQTSLYHFCLGGNYTANSTFQVNLNLLLSGTNSTVPKNISFYKNYTAGRNPNSVYGLLQCRGDTIPDDCKKCVKKATEDITDLCPNRTESIVLYDECSLQYSNRSFISTVQIQPTIYLYNTANFSNPDLFSPKKDELMGRLVVQALSSPNLFATGEENVISSQKLYGLVQCTQDISRTDCERCLRMAVSELPVCCDRRLGARALKPSCNARYETYEFFQPTPAATPPAPDTPLPRITPSPNRNNTQGQEKNSSVNRVAIIVPIVIATVLVFIIASFYCLKRKKGFEIVQGADEITSAESLQFDFATVETATDNFSDANRLGEGGFGVVYKGKLSDGQEIAVKRLSTNSGQGVEEFKNEVLLLAKLQHRNLVRLLGFCLEGIEKLLIYEFVPNASLDKFLFDPVKSTYLNWESRYKIIGGIARGLLYLHEDSRETIIHRDLKASNVLLDVQMNPKISDFGLAKLVLVDQTQGTTSRVVGTYGYMAPEYAFQGQFSVKSDVFSFGVLVLEILSGQRNSSSYASGNAEDLLSNAWKQWEKGNAQELLQPSLRDDYSASEVMRCAHMGLLCVQEDPAKRPSMASIVLMLSSYSVTLPLPSKPAFFGSTFTKSVDMISGESQGDKSAGQEDKSAGCSTPVSVNSMSITDLYPR